MTKLLRSLLLVPVVSLFLVGCAEDQNPVDQGSLSDVTSAESLGKKGGSPKPEAGTILDIAKSDPNFSILVAAVQFAGLEGALSGKRQLTVFAPTNDGFVRLLGRLGLTPEQLFVPGNKELVKSILLYHVVPGVRTSKVVLSSYWLHTLQGEFIRVKRSPAQVGNRTNGFADIIAVDIRASNGVIHVIDDVIVQRRVDVPNIVD